MSARPLGRRLGPRGTTSSMVCAMPNDPTQTVEKAIAGTDAINDAAGPLLREHAAVLAGKVVIDATNPLKPDLTGLPPTGDGIGRRVTAMGGPIGAAVQGLQ